MNKFQETDDYKHALSMLSGLSQEELRELSHACRHKEEEISIEYNKNNYSKFIGKCYKEQHVMTHYLDDGGEKQIPYFYYKKLLSIDDLGRSVFFMFSDDTKGEMAFRIHAGYRPEDSKYEISEEEYNMAFFNLIKKVNKLANIKPLANNVLLENIRSVIADFKNLYELGENGDIL